MIYKSFKIKKFKDFKTYFEGDTMETQNFLKNIKKMATPFLKLSLFYIVVIKISMYL